MNLKRKRLAASRLYLILDAGVCSYDQLFDVLKQVVPAGVDIVQLRDKLGCPRDVLAFTKKALSWLKGRVPFIVNDRVDLARISGADGVHLGQDDIPLGAARKILGVRAIIGVSCQGKDHICKAFSGGADYAGFGSVFKTLTKPDRMPMDQGLLAECALLAERKEFPLFAIGGITAGTAGLVAGQGVRRVAVCRDILLAKDPRQTAETIRRELEFNH
jgi:thiamine-phosphate pyrophosphorylase